MSYISLTTAAASLGSTGRGGGGVHSATLTRWIQKGTLAGGVRVKLKAVRIGSKWATTTDWLTEFVDATTAASLPADVAPARSSAERNRSDARADAALTAAGI